MIRGIGTAVVAAWVAVLVAGRPTPGRLVVLVSLDTVRADVLGAYRGPALTPHLDTFASQSAVLTHHFAAAPTTLASHAALFTGTWPHTHGVPRNGFALAGDRVTLAEILSDAGWATAGFVGARPLHRSTRINQGFEVWDDDVASEREGAVVVDRALAWLDRRDDARPLFLFVHLYDAHAPYDPPEGFLFAHGGPVASTAADPGSMDHLRAVRPTCQDGAALRRLYAAGVSAVDHQVGRLFHGLASRGYADALAVITADHGEAYDVHRECFDHGYTVFDETTRIPLLIRGPGIRAGEVAHLSSNVDVLATVLDLLGLPPAATEGPSFAPALRGEPQPSRGPVFSEATKPYAEDPRGWANADRKKSVRTPTARLVWDPVTGRRELYVDASEVVDRMGDLGATPAARAMDLALAAWVASASPDPAEDLDDAATREALEALGYAE